MGFRRYVLVGVFTGIYVRKLSKKVLWGGNFWTSAYYVNTVGQYASNDAIVKYIQNQGKSQKYQKLYQGQLSLAL
jgi:REP element-mobilizing transposase RayT